MGSFLRDNYVGREIALISINLWRGDGRMEGERGNIKSCIQRYNYCRSDGK